MSASLHLVHGSDPVLVADKVHDLVHQLVGDGDRSLLLEELTEPQYRTDDGVQIRALVDAAQTPPFLTDRRVVVGRDLGYFSTADSIAPLLAYLEDPLATTSLVLVWEKGPGQQRLAALPKKLEQAVTAAGGVVHRTAIPQGKAAAAWFDEQIAAVGVRLDRAARSQLEDRLGEDRSRLRGILETVLAVHGDAKVGPAELGPLLGEAGSVPPWELTDAIAAGDPALALDKLHRMLGAGDRHPLQVMASLHNHYERIMRLDGAVVTDDRDAAALLGIKGSTFPAKKALQLSRRLGSDRIGRALQLLAGADLDLRGATGQPPELVMDVLVARLAALHRR